MHRSSGLVRDAMNSILLIESQVPSMQPRPLSFWGRQFSGDMTLDQVLFDLTFGVIAPILCLSIDPIVFRKTHMGGPIFTQYAAAPWTVIVLGIAALITWLKFQSSPPLLCGVLAGISVYAALWGLVLLPFSLLGILFWGFGLLGLSPFATAAVFGRNAIRAWKTVSFTPRRGSRVSLTLGLCISLLTAWLAQYHVNTQVTNALIRLRSEAPEIASKGERTLSTYRWFVDDELFVAEYQSSTSAPHRKALEQAYRAVTGGDLQQALMDSEDPDQM